MSTDRRGASIIVFISTPKGMHQVIDLLIDRPIADGIIYVPTGISPGELVLLRKEHPVMGEGKKR